MSHAVTRTTIPNMPKDRFAQYLRTLADALEQPNARVGQANVTTLADNLNVPVSSSQTIPHARQKIMIEVTYAVPMEG